MDCFNLYGICNDRNVLNDGRIFANYQDKMLVLRTDKTNFILDSYATKPRKLVKEVYSFEGCDKIGLSDGYHINSAYSIASVL